MNFFDLSTKDQNKGKYYSESQKTFSSFLTRPTPQNDEGKLWFK